MPLRTWLPTISLTWMEMSSPSMIFSPGRRVMISTRPSLPIGAPGGPPAVDPRTRSSGLGGGLLLVAREQRGAHGRLGGFVDDLVAAALVDDDRRPQVGREVLELVGRAHGHPDRDVVAAIGQAGGGRRGV